MNYRIAVDSSANFSGQPFIHAAVPLKIVTDQREYIDDSRLPLAEMLAYLESYKGRSGTSCPNVADWLEAIADAERTFIITITSGLSGCFNSAMQAKAVYEEAHPERLVCVLDSLSTGPEMILIAEKLAELSGQGADFEAAEKAVREYMTHTHLLFSLASLNNLARNGRVSPLVAKATSLLGIRVVGKASSEGTLQPMQKCRGESKALIMILKDMQDLGFTGGKVRIAHCCNASGAQSLETLIRNQYAGSDVSITECTGLCSFYAEKGGILVGFEDSPQ